MQNRVSYFVLLSVICLIARSVATTTEPPTTTSTAPLATSTTTPSGLPTATTAAAPPPGYVVTQVAPLPPYPPAAPVGTGIDTELSKSPSVLPKIDIRSLHIRSDIRYRYATTVISSRLANPANQSQEAVFKVVLPEKAFISKFLMEIDGEVYEAYVREKEAAKQEYDAAVAAGQSAAHVAVNPRDSDTFTVSVNIEPETKVTFNLTYEELLIRRLKSYEHVINIDPGQVVKDLRVDVYIKESRNLTSVRVPELRNEVEIKKSEKDNKVAVIERLSPTEAHITFSPTVKQQEAMSEVGLAGQLAVQYDVTRDLDAGDVMVINGYFVHFFAPAHLPPLPKHVVFVLDTSGSMYGRKMEQTKEAMATILDDLNEEDYFNILDFNSFVTDWFPSPKEEQLNATTVAASGNYTTTVSPAILQHSRFDTVEPTPRPVPTEAYPADEYHTELAKEHVNNLEAAGSTNIHDALQRALDITLAVNLRLTHEPFVVFLTDGEPTVGIQSPLEIIAKTRASNREAEATIFSLAFGEGADFDFLKKLSLQNNGFARKIYEASDAVLQLEGFYQEIANPVLSNVNISYVEDAVESDSVTETSFHQYYSGSELVVAGKLKKENVPNFLLEISGTSLMGTFVSDDVSYYPIRPLPPIIIDPPFPPIDHTVVPPTETPPKNATPAENFIERLWAYLTIKELLKKDELERLEEVTTAVQFDEGTTTETTGNTTTDEVDNSPRARALRLSLKYGFVTPLTSLVVVKPNETSLPDTKLQVQEESDIMAFQQPALFAQPGQPAFFAPPPVQQLHNWQSPQQRPSYAGGASVPASGLNFAQPAPAKATRPPHWLTTRRHTTTTTRLPPAVQLISLHDLTWFGQQVNDTGVSIPDSPQSNDTAFFPLGIGKVDKFYQPCNNTVGQKGHCRHLSYCVLPDFRDKFTIFLDYFCLIDGVYAGVCCPDNTVAAIPTTTSTTTNPTSSSVSTVTSSGSTTVSTPAPTTPSPTTISSPSPTTVSSPAPTTPSPTTISSPPPTTVPSDSTTSS